jgi:hypothetical protein
VRQRTPHRWRTSGKIKKFADNPAFDGHNRIEDPVDSSVYRQRKDLEVARAKRLSREADARALSSGQKTREQLNRENRLIPAEYAVVDLTRVRMSR